MSTIHSYWYTESNKKLLEDYKSMLASSMTEQKDAILAAVFKKAPLYGIGHMWCGTAHEDRLNSAIDWYLENK